MTTDASGPATPKGAETGDEVDDAPADTASGSDAAPPKKPKKERKHLPVWQETILLLGIALVLAVVIKAFFVQAFYIPSESMEPGLVKDDRILVQKPSYWFGGTPQRGDVVVFEDPGGWLQGGEGEGPTGVAKLLSYVGLYPTGGHLVKRVVAVEGDEFHCCDKQGRVEVNGEPVDESDYLAKRVDRCNAPLSSGVTDPRAEDLRRPCDWTITVPEGKLLMLGDNRTQSADSRRHLCGEFQDPCTESPWVDEDLVVGKVFALVWPRDRWTWVSRPDAFDDVPDEPPAGGSGG